MGLGSPGPSPARTTREASGSVLVALLPFARGLAAVSPRSSRIQGRTHPRTVARGDLLIPTDRTNPPQCLGLARVEVVADERRPAGVLDPAGESPILLPFGEAPLPLGRGQQSAYHPASSSFFARNCSGYCCAGPWFEFSAFLTRSGSPGSSRSRRDDDGDTAESIVEEAQRRDRRSWRSPQGRAEFRSPLGGARRPRKMGTASFPGAAARPALRKSAKIELKGRLTPARWLGPRLPRSS